MRSLVATVALVAILTGSQASTPFQYLDPQTFKTSLHQDVTVVINLAGFRENIACSLKTPLGDQIDLSPDDEDSYTTEPYQQQDSKQGRQLPGIQVVEDGGAKISCGVKITVLSADYAGDWEMVATEALHGWSAEERRLNFTLHVEETVRTYPYHDAVVAEGNELQLQLEIPMPEGSICQVQSPNPARQVTSTSQDCGFTIPAVQHQDAGIWEITYEDRIFYKATFELNVTSIIPGEQYNVEFTDKTSVNEEVGPEEAVYCTLVDPSGSTVSQNFGRCRLVLDKITKDHDGSWSMMVALPGKVHLTEFPLVVSVVDHEPKPQVVTSVSVNKPSVYLSCSVATQHPVRLCKFQNPSGEVLIASPGVGEGRYKYYGDAQSSTSGVQSCGLELTSTANSDLGLWRCGIETDEATHYGFLKVLCPWALMNPVIAASVVTEPTLTAADLSKVLFREDDAVTMSCSVQASIKYCYFRAGNGSVFSVNPETSSPGFDAGECSMRLERVSLLDDGAWSCHAGLVDQSREQTASLRVHVRPKMAVSQFTDTLGRLVVRGDTGKSDLDYCRFVRIDGLGFTSDSTPDRYTSESKLSSGFCSIVIARPTILEHHPWTVVASKDGREISGTTQMSLLMPEIFYNRNGLSSLLWLLILAVLPAVVMVLLLSNRRGREWTARRASSIRSSFRRPTSYNTTPVVADSKEVTKVPLE
ncbi:uncharacterized protein LOC105386750 [Plutella xylostella]|uniref:uncharacterized protein LOC105386750 n=1 Tax=Plutella xylostella TaxID=51655 RepID=UPI00203300F6|nr:uncharacterized protein LOC105386750 [Plutella xylostella]